MNRAIPGSRAVIQIPQAPPVYRPVQTSPMVAVQRKEASGFRRESRPAPAVYRPEPARLNTAQPKSQPVQPQAQYELASPAWVGNGRQQIRVKLKGSSTPIGSVDVHYQKGGKAYISDLEVTQAHRRHGVGTMLMKAAMDSARRNGSMATELEANPGPGSISKQSLVGMYQKLGFRNTGISRRGNPKLSTR